MKLTRSQVREIDRRTIQDFHLPGVVLMENAARAVADQALDMMSGRTGVVMIVCGGGNNGGDGLAVARLLHNRGLVVHIKLTVDPARYAGDALVQWNVARAMKLAVAPFDPTNLGSPALIVDAIFGTGLDKPPRPPFDGQADAINASGIPVLSVDVPSGLDCDTGSPPGACVVATRTVTFVAEKIGFDHTTARRFLGRVVVGDIGCPSEVIPQ